MAESWGEFRRKSHRIRYQAQTAPYWEVEGVKYVVVDIALESIAIKSINPLREGKLLSGVLHFNDGYSLFIQGRVVKQVMSEYVLQLGKSLPVERFQHELANSAAGSDRRQYFRLRYPTPGIAPVITIDKIAYPLVETSEKGLILICSAPLRFPRGKQIQGNITFKDGQSFSLVGEVVRLGADTVVIKIVVGGIPESIMFREQQRVINMFRK